MVQVFEVDFESPEHCKAVIDLMNHYMTDKMGDHAPHTEESAKRLIEGLKNHQHKLCILAEEDGNYIGLVNIHDVVVLDTQRGKGIGRLMLEFVAKKAQESDSAKITLEVRHDNLSAQQLYKNLGYADGDHPMYFWTKYL
jgi:GNAT superfamily N-acetyltransferase